MYEIKGDLIKIAREQQHCSREVLAKLTCLSHRHIEQLENNSSKIFFNERHRYLVALKVIHALQLDPDLIIFEVPSPTESLSLDSNISINQTAKKNSNLFLAGYYNSRHVYRFFLIVGVVTMALISFDRILDLVQNQVLSEINAPSSVIERD